MRESSNAHFKVDAVAIFLHFHGFLLSLMKLFEEFAMKSYCGNFRTIFWIDNIIVIAFIGGFFDIG